MNYELFMGEALAEARNALARGERPIAAVAVVDEAMVARAHDRVQESNDPTAHAVVVALRETARKLGTDRLASATIFATLEPCSMCVGALLQSDVEALVYAVPNTLDGAAGTVIQLAQHPALGQRVNDVPTQQRDLAMVFQSYALYPHMSIAENIGYPVMLRAAYTLGGLGSGQCSTADELREFVVGPTSKGIVEMRGHPGDVRVLFVIVEFPIETGRVGELAGVEQHIHQVCVPDG